MFILSIMLNVISTFFITSVKAYPILVILLFYWGTEFSATFYNGLLPIF